MAHETISLQGALIIGLFTTRHWVTANCSCDIQSFVDIHGRQKQKLVPAARSHHHCFKSRSGLISINLSISNDIEWTL